MRSLDTTLAAQLTANLIYPVQLVQLTFYSQTVYVWSGPGSLVWDGQTFTGVGSLGSVGAITEGIDVNALLSGYKLNRFSWLAGSDESSWELIC